MVYDYRLRYDPTLEFDRGWSKGYSDAMNWRYCAYVATESFNRGYVAGHKTGTADRRPGGYIA